MNRLRELRKERGLSQKKLAELVRVHTRTVQHWEYGTSQIKLKKAEELADILGVGVHELLGFKTEKEFKLPKGKEYILFLNNILIDELQKVTVPQFVADWIEECKENNIISLSGAFEYAKGEVEAWFSSWENQETFAIAWINGYTVNEEKRYLVKLKGMVEDFVVLKLDKIRDGWYLGNDTEYSHTKVKHTRKELEDAGFGEAFNSPLFEVEEVE